MTKSEYYYGCKPDAWDSMLYFDAIKDREQKAKKLWTELYRKENKTYEEEVRYYRVYKAWKLNEKLLSEREMM